MTPDFRPGFADRVMGRIAAERATAANDVALARQFPRFLVAVAAAMAILSVYNASQRRGSGSWVEEVFAIEAITITEIYPVETLTGLRR